jgi:hypothetical protein
MANIPPDKPFPTFSSEQAKDTVAVSQQDKLKSKISSVSLSVLAKNSEVVKPLPSEVVKPLPFVPPLPGTPIYLFKNPEFGLKNLFLRNLENLKTTYGLPLLQSFISQIESVDTLLEIWIELLQKPEEDSLEDLLVNVFQAIYEKDKDSSVIAYTQTGQRLKIKKRLADCIRPDDYEFFLDKFIEKNAHFSIALFSKKLYDKCMREVDARCTSDRTWRYLEFDFPPLSEGERICHALYRIYMAKPLDDLKGLTLDEFQHICFYFFEAGWGTKEEFLTKALCSFWNEITSTNSKKIKTCLEGIENGILDIGRQQDPNLFSGNLPHFVLLFSLGILFPTIQQKIRAGETSPFPVKPSELFSDITTLDPDTSRFIDKIRTLLLPPEEAIKNLKEVNQSNPESFPCIRAKHPQFSGSCTVKNLNSLLSMSSTAPSIIMHGGFTQHSIYAEVFKSGDKYYALVHNLGAGSDIHQKHHGNKIIPLALCFEEKENLIQFSKIFCKEETTDKEYLALVETHQFEVSDPESALPFVRSLSFIDSSRTNPMHSVYREFRKLQREIIRKLIDPTGSPSEVKEVASAKRKEQKKQKEGKATGGQ